MVPYNKKKQCIVLALVVATLVTATSVERPILNIARLLNNIELINAFGIKTVMYYSI